MINQISFWTMLFRLNLQQQIRRLGLLILAAVLGAVLAVLAGQSAQHFFEQGVQFDRIQLAVTAPKNDRLPGLLEKYMNGMEDIRQYCQVTAMEQEEAFQALENNQVSAVVILPEKFVHGIQYGENPDVQIVVNGSDPLKSMLILSLGESASDLLAAFQSSIYAVSDLYDRNSPPGLDREHMLTEINLRYIQWSLNRQDLFAEEKVLPTVFLPIHTHYSLCILSFLILALIPLTAWPFQERWLTGQKRLRYVGFHPLAGFFSSFGGIVVIMTPILWVLFTWAVHISAGVALGAAVLGAFFFAALCSLLCLAGKSSAACGTASVLIGIAGLIVSGGVVPSVLLPEAVSRLSVLSPVSWLRDLLATALEDESMMQPAAVLLAASAAITAVSAFLYCRRSSVGGENQ